MQNPREARRRRRPKGSFIGLTTVDIVFGFDRYPAEDTKNTANEYTVCAGGPASNAAVSFAYLGGDVRLISALGRSNISGVAKKDLMGHGVKHIDIAARSDCEPALSAIATVAKNASRTIFTSPSIDKDLAGPFDDGEVRSYVDGCDIVLVDGHQLPLANLAARRARDLGIPVVLDGDQFHQGIDELLPWVDVVIFGNSFCIDNKSAHDIFLYFQSFGIKQVGATHGAEPIEFVSDGVAGVEFIPRVDAVDTLGAGDFLHGAFCYYYCKGKDFRQSLKLAARVASTSVTSFGTREWMKKHEPDHFE